MHGPLLVYGANGYTGELIARLAASRGERPILAGRRGEALAPLAAELGLERRVFGLDDAGALDGGLRGAGVVLHCAGPFVRTARPMAEACLRGRIHYLDITGEVAVFEALRRRDKDARAAGVMLLPGAGFDVVPTDCLAAHLKRRLPSASRLVLAFQSSGGTSRGTATTMVENAGKGGLVRRDGRLTPVPAAWKTRAVDFGRGPRTCVTIPWGDLSTAYHSTGIPNLEVYMAAPALVHAGLRLTRVLGPLLGTAPVQAFVMRRVRAGAAGPSAEARARARCFFWGEASDGSGGRAAARLSGPEGYTLTARAALALAGRALAGDAPPGYQTPSSAYGPDFVLGLEGVAREDL